MQAYANEARAMAKRPGLRLSRPSASDSVANDPNPPLLDQLLSRVADLVAERLIERSGANAPDPSNEWMDAREAAAYLGMHRDTLRKLAAQRSIPAHQDGPRCKLYFNRDELDDWRRSAHPRLRAVA